MRCLRSYLRGSAVTAAVACAAAAALLAGPAAAAPATRAETPQALYKRMALLAPPPVPTYRQGTAVTLHLDADPSGPEGFVASLVRDMTTAASGKPVGAVAHFMHPSTSTGKSDIRLMAYVVHAQKAKARALFSPGTHRNSTGTVTAGTARGVLATYLTSTVANSTTAVRVAYTVRGHILIAAIIVAAPGKSKAADAVALADAGVHFVELLGDS